MDDFTGRDTVRRIIAARRDGRLADEFGSGEFETAVPGLAPRTYHNFLPKQRVGKPVKPGQKPVRQWFVRVAPGRYRLKPGLIENA